MLSLPCFMSQKAPANLPDLQARQQRSPEVPMRVRPDRGRERRPNSGIARTSSPTAAAITPSSASVRLDLERLRQVDDREHAEDVEEHAIDEARAHARRHVARVFA